MVASLIESLGVYLGHTGDLFDPLPTEPRSHWEHGSLRALNERVLARSGGRWDDPPHFELGWEHAAALNDVRAQARAALATHFAGHPVWGWKDPRTCLTLPFWQPLVPHARYVICLRHPLEVARSVRARDGFPLAHGLRLWLGYTAAALRHTAGHPRLVLFYDDVLRQPAAAVAALGGFVGATGAASGAAIARIAPDRRHHRCTEVALRGDGECSTAVRGLYARLRTLAPAPGVLAPEADAAMTVAAAEPGPGCSVLTTRNRLEVLLAPRRVLAVTTGRARTVMMLGRREHS